MDLETITVEAPDETQSGTDGVLLDIPGETTLGGETLERQQGGGLAGLLQGMAGVAVEASAEEAGMAVNIRGMQDVGRVAVTIDGVRQNFARSGHGANGQFFADPEMLRSVTVTRPRAVVAVVLVVVARDVLASRSVVAGRASAYERPRIMAGRVTDPAHHPVRTRAPGHR